MRVQSLGCEGKKITKYQQRKKMRERGQKIIVENRILGIDLISGQINFRGW